MKFYSSYKLIMISPLVKKDGEQKVMMVRVETGQPDSSYI